MNPLTSIPPKIRAALYWIGYLVGVVGQGTTIVWGAIAAASPDIAMPLGLVITSAVLGLLQTQLNLLSGSNMTATGDGAPKPRRRRGEGGFLGGITVRGASRDRTLHGKARIHARRGRGQRGAFARGGALLLALSVIVGLAVVVAATAR